MKSGSPLGVRTYESDVLFSIHTLYEFQYKGAVRNVKFSDADTHKYSDQSSLFRAETQRKDPLLDSFYHSI